MSAANDLIERMERETGQRCEDNDGDNAATAGLLGAMARMMDKSQHAERDDVAAGLLIRHMMTDEYKAEQEREQYLALLLSKGLSPDAFLPDFIAAQSR